MFKEIMEQPDALRRAVFPRTGGALHGGAAAEKAVQDLQPALGLVDVQAVFPLGEDGNPGGVIPSVLQAGEWLPRPGRR